MSENWCDYGNHEITELGGFVIYSDKKRGIECVKTCKHCYALHVLKYFPDTIMAKYLKKNPKECHLTLEEIGEK